MIDASRSDGGNRVSVNARAPDAGALLSTTGLERFAYVGLLAFIVLLYSNIGVIVPALAPIQPAKLVAVVALAALVAGRLARDAALRFDPPQTLLVFGLVVLAACSVYGALWQSLAVQSLVDFAKMAAVYLLVVHVVDRPARLRLVAITLIICSLVPALATIRRAVLGADLVDRTRAAWVGLFADPNELAYSLVLLVPLTMALFDTGRARLGRAGLAMAAVIQVAAVMATQSRGGLLGLLVVLGLVVWRYRVRGGVLVIAGVVAVIGVAFAADALWRRLEVVAAFQQDDAITSRLQAWRVGWAIVLDRWWLGVGIGNFALAWPLYADSPGGKWFTAHNAFIQILGELGVMGFIGLVALVTATLVGLRRTRQLASGGGAPEVESFAAGLGISLWGYVSCGMLLSVAFNWFLYLIVGLSVSVIAMAPRSATTGPTSPWGRNGRMRPWG